MRRSPRRAHAGSTAWWTCGGRGVRGGGRLVWVFGGRCSPSVLVSPWVCRPVLHFFAQATWPPRWTRRRRDGMVAPFPGRHRAEGTACGITRRERWVVSQGLCWSPWGRLPSFRGASAVFTPIAAWHTHSAYAGPFICVSTSRTRSRGLLIGQPASTVPGVSQCCHCRSRLLLLPVPKATLLTNLRVQGRHNGSGSSSRIRRFP